MNNLNEWFKYPLGGAVAESIRKQFESADEPFYSLFYHHCLQIGTSERILNNPRVYMLNSAWCGDAHVIAQTDTLPFANECFSMVFLPFTLENISDTGLILSEVSRVLRPDGSVLIASINPWSLWGVARACHAQALWSTDIHLRSSLHIYSLLSSGGFQVHWIKSFFYRPPLSSRVGLKKTRFLEPVGQMFWPYPGGVYLLLAKKVTPSLLSVKPLWQGGGYVFGKA